MASFSLRQYRQTALLKRVIILVKRGDSVMLKRLLTVISLHYLTTVVLACKQQLKSSGNQACILLVATVAFYGVLAMPVGGCLHLLTSIIDNPAIAPQA